MSCNFAEIEKEASQEQMKKGTVPFGRLLLLYMLKRDATRAEMLW